MKANPSRIEEARLGANMSRADLAFAIRQATGGVVKADAGSVRRWEKGLNGPSDGIVPAIAAATNHDIDFFYEAGGDTEDDEEAALPAELLMAVRQLARVLAGATA